MNQPVNDTLSSWDNLRIEEINEPITPIKLIYDLPLDKNINDFVEKSRCTVSDIVNMNDDRLLVITWPCSIHNRDEAIEYAKKLVEIKENNPNLFIVMRTYFEKPRTTLWWKGLVNDPDLDWTCNIDKWLYLARELLIEINKMWIPTSTEFLDTLTPQYFADLISWWAIWARTTESQEHRKLVSWLSMPVGFKNWTTWDIKIAIDAIWASKSSHIFLWANKEGKIATMKTSWNPDWHIILRWWSGGPNYKEEYIIDATICLNNAWINTGIIVDFSHANSEKDHKRQWVVAQNISNQIKAWDTRIVWVMIEWNLQEWAQSYTPWIDDKSKLKQWVSITDKCVGWKINNKILSLLNNAVGIRNNND